MLAAALELIDDATEVRSITMDAIAERAGISKVTLYRRWSSKAALIADALLEQLMELVPIDTSKAPLPAITEHVLSLGVALDGKIGQLLRIVAAECLMEPTTMQTFRERYISPRRSLVIKIIGNGLRDGSVTTPSSAAECHDMLYGALFFRFLFGLGDADPASLDRLVTATLQVTVVPPGVTGRPTTSGPG